MPSWSGPVHVAWPGYRVVPIDLRDRCWGAGGPDPGGAGGPDPGRALPAQRHRCWETRIRAKSD